MGTRARSQARPRTRSGGHRAGAQRHAARRRFLHLRRGFRQGARHARRPRRARSRRPSPPRRWKSSAWKTCPKPATASRWSPIPPRPSRSSCTATRKLREAALAKTGRLTLEQLHKQMAAGEVKELPIIIKADVQRFGRSARRDPEEALHRQGQDPGDPRRRGRHQRIRRAAGLGFERHHHRLQRAAGAQRRGAGGAGEGGHPPAHHHLQRHRRDQEGHDAACWRRSYKEVYRGKAEVRDTFRITKVGTVAGCMVQDGNDHARFRSPPAARQRGGAHRQDRLAAALQGRRQRSEAPAWSAASRSRTSATSSRAT